MTEQLKEYIKQRKVVIKEQINIFQGRIAKFLFQKVIDGWEMRLDELERVENRINKG